MKISIVIIGDEIMLGRVTDTNSGLIARTFDPYGFDVTSIRTVGDNAQAITDAIHAVLAEADLVFTTGGLGPTKDDITKGVMLDIFGGEMVRDMATDANVRRIFEARGLEMNALTDSQAMVPSSCRVIVNQYGTAPVMWFERDGKVLITLPGVPAETANLLPSDIVPAVLQRFAPNTTIEHSTLVVTGISESALAEKLDEFENSLPAGFSLAYLPDSPILKLRLDGRGDKSVSSSMVELTQRLKTILGDLVIAEGDKSIGEIVVEMCRARGWKLATAESCTGGTIASMITAIAGCSDTYVGGIVSYSNDVKVCALGVPTDALNVHGAVSEPVVRAMAEGAAQRLGAQVSVATSGIAGPGGGSIEKPVGTVWIATHVNGITTAHVHHFNGNRAAIVARAAKTALISILKAL